MQSSECVRQTLSRGDNSESTTASRQTEAGEVEARLGLGLGLGSGLELGGAAAVDLC